MPLARARLLIHDDIIQPRPQINLHFSGVNPTIFYHELPKIISSVFRMHAGALQEKKSQYTKGDTEKVKVSWEGFKDLDKFSFYQIELELEGSAPKGGVGTAAVQIKAGLRTEYPQDTYWERSLLYEVLRMFWHTMFYQSKREDWLKEGRRLVAVFTDQVKKLAYSE